MAALKERFGTHLNEGARRAIERCQPYPPVHVFINPMTRAVARAVAQRNWRATLSQINFPYTMDDVVVGGVDCVRFRTSRTDPANPVILYLHAGAYVAGSPRDNASAVLPACELSGCEAIGVRYGLAPEAVFPTQLDEIERVYRALIGAGRAASRIFILGDSAGGALALSSVNRWRGAGLAPPAGIIALSPLTDGAAASDTHLTLQSSDPIFGDTAFDGVKKVTSLYAPSLALDDPQISPVYASFRDAPPMLIHVGAREALLGDSARLAEKARRDGVEVNLRVFDGMFHLFHMNWSLEEARAVYEDIASFIARLSRRPGACRAA